MPIPIPISMRPSQPRRLTLGLAAAAMMLVGPGAQAASFPCAKAETPDETAICAHLPLNDLDVEMAVRFEILRGLLPMGGNAKLREDQETWLQERRSCAADVSCLTRAYETRLKTLRGVFSEFAKQGPL